MQTKNLRKFTRDRDIYGTLGCIQKMYEYHDVPESFALAMLTDINIDLGMRFLEHMSDSDLHDLIDGTIVIYSEMKTPTPA